ncbi:Uncharacterised protein [Mycobacteroides abscessus subsp. abscessus]|nr:Uncharacterised protein [Mycobacteroides abscessus subsp. abscessus]
MAASGAVAFHSTDETYSVTSTPSSSFCGAGSFFLVMVAVQPAFCWVLTEMIGWSSGRTTSSAVVDAVSDSVGTRKFSTPQPPWVASPVTLTWAAAGAARATAQAVVAVTAAMTRKGLGVRISLGMLSLSL